MKSKRWMIVGGLAAGLLSACSSRTSQEDFGPVLFQSQISGVQPRMSNNVWDTNDEIGIFMLHSKGSEENRKYLASTDGTLTPAEGNEIYYPTEGTADFLAYYPYRPELTQRQVPISVADQRQFSSIDFLYSNNARSIASGSVVHLQFRHLLSLISLNITTDETITDKSGLKVTLTGMNTKASVQLNDGNLSISKSPAPIAMKVHPAGTLAEAIVLPAPTVDQMQLVFTLGETAYTCPFPALQGRGIESGNKYILNAILSIKENKVAVTLDRVGIIEWTEVNGGDLNIPLEQVSSNEVSSNPTASPVALTPIEGGTELFFETFGHPGDNSPSVAKYTGWTDKHHLTYKDQMGTAVIRETQKHDGHLWLPAGKTSSFRITGFQTTGYTTLQLSYDVTTSFTATAPNQNTILISTDGTQVPVPSQPLSASDEYQHVIVNLPVPMTYLQFSGLEATNKWGFRIDNIRLVAK